MMDELKLRQQVLPAGLYPLLFYLPGGYTNFMYIKYNWNARRCQCTLKRRFLKKMTFEEKKSIFLVYVTPRVSMVFVKKNQQIWFSRFAR